MIPEVNKKLYLASDIEANGLLVEVSKLWCLVSIDVMTEEVYLFHDYPEYDNAVVKDIFDDKEYTIPKRTGTFKEGVEFWQRVADKGGKLIVHNCFGYDKPVLERFYPDFKTPRSAWRDTLLQSKEQWYQRPTPKGSKSKHGLHGWGCRFGINKPDIKDWSFIDAFKLHRCIEDCKIQRKTFIYLEKEKKMLRDKLGINLSECYGVDSEYSEWVSQQEVNGAMVDKPYMEECVKELDALIEDLAKDIEPQLPKTLIKKTSKIENSKLAAKLGFKKKVVDRLVPRKIKGEIEMVPFKKYFDPTNPFVNKKSTGYTAFNVSYGDTPSFSKITDLRGYINDNYPDTKFVYPDKKGNSDWEVSKEELSVTEVAPHTCSHFNCNPDDVDLFSGYYTKIDWETTRMSQQDKVKAYLIKLGWKPDEWNFKKDPDGKEMWAEEDFIFLYPKVASRSNQIKIKVKRRQKIPTSPKLTESSYDSLPEGIGKKIAEYNTYQHRRRFLKNADDDTKGLLNNIRPDGRISCGVGVFSTRSSRSVQTNWVNPPSAKALYGKQVRKCIIAPEGKVLIGVDQKSCELSLAAYYANNDKLYDAIISGKQEIRLEDGTTKYLFEDGHSKNSISLGLFTKSEVAKAVETQDHDLIEKLCLIRDKGKMIVFSILYGAGDAKVAANLGISVKEAKLKKEAFFADIGIDNVIRKLEISSKKYACRGGWYQPSPFGFWIWGNKSNANLNTLIQSSGAVAQKLAVNMVERELKVMREERGIDVFKVIDYHDEMLLECEEGYEDEVGRLVCDCYSKAGKMIYEWHLAHPDMYPNEGVPSFYSDLAGSYKVGKTYLDCH